MAWISGLADKAENILNKLDQNAATALSQVPQSANDAFVEIRSSDAMAFKTLSPAKTPDKNTPRTERSTRDLQQYLMPVTDTPSHKSSIDSKDVITITVAPEENSYQSQNERTSLSQIHELAAFKIALAEVTTERDALRTHLLKLNNDIETNTLRMRVKELENVARCLNEEREALQEESLKLQTENGAYTHSISELEANLAKLHQEYLEIAQKLQMQKKETDQQRQDLQEYRFKAQHTLQMKDNLINELKSNGTAAAVSGNSATSVDEPHVLKLEYNTMRQELDSVKEERQLIINQVEQLREQLLQLSNEHAQQLSEVRENDVALRKELRLERERLLTKESEQRVLTKEVYTLRQQYNQHLADAKTRLHEKELELQQLKNSKTNESDENAVKSKKFSDAEVRLKALTQALVEKQYSVELITSEKNALRIQLEKLQEQLSNYKQNYQNSNSARNAFHSNSTDDVKAQFPMLMSPNPFDNRVARRVKRAYSSLDSAGVRLGAFLRRYPLMRVFVLMYVALLHIWVMFVLLSSTPN